MIRPGWPSRRGIVPFQGAGTRMALALAGATAIEALRGIRLPPGRCSTQARHDLVENRPRIPTVGHDDGPRRIRRLLGVLALYLALSEDRRAGLFSLPASDRTRPNCATRNSLSRRTSAKCRDRSVLHSAEFPARIRGMSCEARMYDIRPNSPLAVGERVA